MREFIGEARTRERGQPGPAVTGRTARPRRRTRRPTLLRRRLAMTLAAVRLGRAKPWRVALTGHDVLMDGMKSLSPKCDRLKQLYESCFNKWFAEHYLKGDNSDHCQPLFRIYQECVKQTLLEHRIDWSENGTNLILQRMENNDSSSTGSRFDNLEQCLESFIENSRQLCMVASDFQASSQTVLNQKIQAVLGGLQELSAKHSKFNDIKIPVELLDYVDAGKNPQLYTKDCIEKTLIRNKEVNGKIEQYKKFRACLLNELTDLFPKETIQYRTIREDDPAAGRP
ncbi:mediator of RNA polymerase II transcription subunit 10 [Trichinella spiralis]|uniref:Mediator of RNA polymerase II transcription subunit 10 n=1 Tax=Trichinella spiralis TaxID=6334 RepID=E5S7D1_TRISP|nr:mediator of RNA polymerase II transcription subunit 10 [Trichinella spiralis]KRY39289.1 Mediator of RNA polymerase II transcription subunit 10 [Trichinella spiralis]